MAIDLQKLEIQLKDQHEHTTAFLQTIIETIDHIVEENKQQGEDIARNTKAIKLMEVEMEEIRRKLDKQEERVESAAESGAKSAVRETLPKAVDKGIQSVMEPTKRGRGYIFKRSKLSRLKFWR